jgi:hypothetical protein
MDAKHQTPKQAMGGHEPPAPHAPIPPGQVAYEKTDIDPRSITRIAIVLAVLTTAAAGIVFGLFQLLANRAEGNDPPPPPLSRPAEGARAPEPRLQTAPVADLAAIQEEERRTLGAYGWADEAAGVARIPIEEAMALYVRQAGRPAASTPAAAASPGAGNSAQAPAVTHGGASASPEMAPSPLPSAPGGHR